MRYTVLRNETAKGGTIDMDHKSIKYQLSKTAAFGSMISLLLTVVILYGASNLFLGMYSGTIETRIGEVFAAHGVNGPEFFGDVIDSINDDNVIRSMSLRTILPSLAIVLVFPLVMGLTSWTVSKRMSRKIQVPLDELKTAAVHATQGDLDYKINYDGLNEFGMVCDAFTDMQVHLKAYIGRNIAQEQSRKELLAGISHDLRTPLTAIRGYVKGLQDGVANTPEKQEKYLDTILTKTYEMEKLVERLFAYSRLDAGNECFALDTIAADEYMAGFIEVVRPDAAQKGLELVYEPGAAEGLSLKLDCDQMYRVFTNILDNSAKYKCADAGVVTIKTWSDADTFTIEFADNGEGVSEECLDKLFDTFYRTDPARTATSKGSGLGLSIAKKIVTAHGGHIAASNRQGLVITINIPIRKVDVA